MGYLLVVVSSISLVIAVAGFAAHAMPVGGGAMLVSAAAGLAGYRKLCRPAYEEEAPELFQQELKAVDEVTDASFKKACADYNFIQQSIRNINDSELQQQLQKMQQIAGKLLSYLQQHPEKVGLARRFIDYYQDRAVELVKKYQSLESTGLATEKIIEVKQNIMDTLDSFDEAYEDQFTKLIDEQLLDAEAELKVIKQVFQADGISNGDEKTADSAKAANNHEPDFIMVDNEQPVEEVVTDKNIIPENINKDVWITKFIAAGFGIFLGNFGAHKFYLGKTGLGIVYLMLFWTFIPGFIGFIEGIRYLFMRRDDFYEQYYVKLQNKRKGRINRGRNKLR